MIDGRTISQRIHTSLIWLMDMREILVNITPDDDVKSEVERAMAKYAVAYDELMNLMDDVS